MRDGAGDGLLPRPVAHMHALPAVQCAGASDVRRRGTRRPPRLVAASVLVRPKSSGSIYPMGGSTTFGRRRCGATACRRLPPTAQLKVVFDAVYTRCTRLCGRGCCSMQKTMAARRWTACRWGPPAHACAPLCFQAVAVPGLVWVLRPSPAYTMHAAVMRTTSALPCASAPVAHPHAALMAVPSRRSRRRLALVASIRCVACRVKCAQIAA